MEAAAPGSGDGASQPDQAGPTSEVAALEGCVAAAEAKAEEARFAVAQAQVEEQQRADDAKQEEEAAVRRDDEARERERRPQTSAWTLA